MASTASALVPRRNQSIAHQFCRNFPILDWGKIRLSTAICGFRRLRAVIPIDRGQRSERSRAPFRVKAGSRLPSAA
jgi:hypothetical protein